MKVPLIIYADTEPLLEKLGICHCDPEFCEISKNTFFTEHLWATASEYRNRCSTKLYERAQF